MQAELLCALLDDRLCPCCDEPAPRSSRDLIRHLGPNAPKRALELPGGNATLIYWTEGDELHMRKWTYSDLAHAGCGREYVVT
jgi:hypothetical protein